MLLGTLWTSLLGNMLTGKGILNARYGNKQGKRILWLILKYRNVIRMNLGLMEFNIKMIGRRI